MHEQVDADALKFMADEFRRKADGELDAEKREEVEEDFFVSLRDNDFEKLEETLDELEEEHGIVCKDIRQFGRMVTEDDLIEKTEQESVEAELSDGTAQAIKMQVKDTDEDEMIVRTDETIEVGDVMHIQDQVYEDEGKKAFVISDQKTWEGRVSVELSGTKEKIQLLAVYDGEDGLAYRHLGESMSNYKGKKQIDEHAHGFFIYKFVSDQKEYLLFSTESLDPMTCDVHGMHFKLADYKKMGENAGMPINKDIIFAHHVEPAIESLDKEDLREMARMVDHDWLAENLLGDWRHPEWFEKLLLCMDMVNEEHGFPSGMLWMAAPGTGKSVTLKALADAHNEAEGVHTGTASTIKGLTPSFAESPPDEGFLLRTTRVAAVDEIFNLLSDAANSGSASMKDAFRPLLDLVEHQDRTFSSGNGSIRGKMQSVMIGAGNDSYGVSSMYEAAENLDPAFLSRFLLYEQTPQHIQYIEDRKYEIQEQDASGPEGNPEFISLIDHLQSEIQVNVDVGKVREIKERLKDQVPSNFQDIYRSRYDHHIKNLVSAHAKYRCIVSGSFDFSAKEEDYEFAEHIVEILINSWVENVDLNNMSLQARPYYLQRGKRRIYEYVKHNYPVGKGELEEEFENCSYTVEKLTDLDLLRPEGDEYYPYFAETENQGNKKFGNIKNSKEIQ